MLVAAAILTALGCATALVWLSRHAMISIEQRKGFILTEDYRGRSADRPRISIVLAAKDEEENIEPCVRTLLDQDYDDFEMLVCNDRSTDATAEIVRKIAATDSRLKLLTIEQLPEGWSGKNNAMQTGIARTSGQWICMIDADCRQTSRRTLRAAVQYAQDCGADMLSVLPTLEMRGFWENVVQPVCGGIMMIWFHPDRVNSPRHSNAYANGAFMLIKRSAYEAIGTHEAIKDRVNEDIHMAARLKQSGLKLCVVRNRGLYLSRMYTSLPQIIHGWSRIFFGTFLTLRRISLSLAVLLVVSLSPYLTATAGLILATLGVEPVGWWTACGLAGLVAVALQLTTIWRFYRLMSARPWLAWAYPLGCLVAAWTLVLSLSKLRRGAKIVWRSTSYVRASQDAK